MNVLRSIMPDVRFLGEDHKDRDYTGHEIEGIEIYFNTRKNDYSSTDLRYRVCCVVEEAEVMDHDYVEPLEI